MLNRIVRMLLVLLVLATVAQTVSVVYAEGGSPTDAAIQACNSPISYKPVASGTKIKAKGEAHCDYGYHTYKVCLYKDIPLWPDPYYCGAPGDGTWADNTLERISCFSGQGNYYTYSKLDGKTSESGRVYLNCS